MAALKTEHKIAIFTIVAFILVWVVDSAYDSFVAHEGPFFSLLTQATEHEPFLRSVLSLGFLSFGLMIAWMVKKQHKAEVRLEKQSAAIESSMDGVAIYDPEGNYVYVNQSYATINGYESPAEIIGKNFRSAYEDSELEKMSNICFPALKKNGRWRGELVARRKNGSTYVQEASVTQLEDGGRICITRDVTWRKRSEERLRKSEQFLNTIFDSIRDPFCIFDKDYRVIRANAAYAELKRIRMEDLIGKRCYEALENRQQVCNECVVDKSLVSADPCAKEKQMALADGTSIWLEIYTYPILDDAGVVTHVIEYTREVTERKKSDDEKRRLIEKLEYLSSTDSLTGLMNRRALMNSLTYEVDRARRYDSELSLILCDIDDFKDINDSLGHDAGDRVLQSVAATLRSVLRKSDIAGRYGGDEFMLILPVTAKQGAERLAEKLLAAVQSPQPSDDGREPIRMSMSIGVSSLTPEDGNIDALIKRADKAMYVSKLGGKSRVSSG
jgi:diguanylate cyclase (GGDEF)-like protein/PAS domain S-box-containing protein